MCQISHLGWGRERLLRAEVKGRRGQGHSVIVLKMGKRVEQTPHKRG